MTDLTVARVRACMRAAADRIGGKFTLVHIEPEAAGTQTYMIYNPAAGAANRTFTGTLAKILEDIEAFAAAGGAP